MLFWAAVFLLTLMSVAEESFGGDLKISTPIIPPHATRDGTGRELEIVRESLNLCGHSVSFDPSPYGRHWQQYLDNPSFEAVTTVPADKDLAGHVSMAHITYQNGIAYLSDRGMQIMTRNDIRGLDVVTFEGGEEMLQLNRLLGRDATITEKANQLIHSKMLLSERVDAIIADGLVIAEMNKRVRAQNQPWFNQNTPVRFQALFPPSKFHVVFRKKALRDDFNRCFQHLADTGRIKAINNAYVSPYVTTLGAAYLTNRPEKKKGSLR